MRGLLILLLIFPVVAWGQVQELQLWWADIGETDSTCLGHGIVNLGDINFDGLSDFIVGSGDSKAYVYFGNTEPDTLPDLILNCPDNDVELFCPLANIGDVNLDGEDDILIWGAAFPPWDEVRRVYLYFGGEAFDSIPDLSFEGHSGLGSYFGYQAASVGDFNGDSWNDFAILDFGIYFTPDPGEGHFYLYYGGEILDSIPDWEISPGHPFSEVAGEAAPLGDINDDGYDDFVMGDAGCEGPLGEYQAGVLAIYYGSAEPDTIADLVFYGDEFSALGRSLVTLDFDQDGKKDMIVGTGINSPPNHSSSILIYLASPELDSIPDYFIPDQGGQGYSIGTTLLGIDLNGDGWQDIVSGNPGCVLNSGKVYVILGGANPDTLIDATYFQSNTNGNLGSFIGNVGDINGDFIEDLAISEFGFPGFPWLEHNGKFHVIKGDTAIHQSVGIPTRNQIPIPTSQILVDIHPNPFNSTTVINFELPVAGEVEVGVYDIFGRNVGANLVFAQKGGRSQGSPLQPGCHQFTFDAGGLPSGVYFVRLEAGDYRAIKKVVLLK